MSAAIKTEALSKRYLCCAPGDYDSAARVPHRPLLRLASGAAGIPGDRASWALKKVSIEIEHGEMVGLIGAPGSGKSTLFKVLARVTEPTSGLAIVEGRIGTTGGYGTELHPQLTVRDNIFMSGAILGMKRAEIERRFDAILSFADLKERISDTPVQFHSHRKRMRLAFAVATHLEVNILLVDELGASDDRAFQRRALERIAELGRQGRTMLFASHQLDHVRSLCARSIWLERGRVAKIGETTEVVKEYEVTLAMSRPSLS